MKELRVTPIKNGTVIDHITAGMAFKVLKILGVTGPEIRSTISVVMHVPSQKGGWKDIVKVEDRELDPTEVDRIALVAPKVSINIIRNYNVVQKYKPNLPEHVVGLLRCENPNCITNKEREPVRPKFHVIHRDPVKLRCSYCERMPTNIAEDIL